MEKNTNEETTLKNTVDENAKSEQKTSQNKEQGETKTKDESAENIFSRIIKKIAEKFKLFNYKQKLKKSIKNQFAEKSQGFRLIDQGLKSLTPWFMVEVDEKSKTLTILGNPNLKNNTLMKNKDGDIFKVISKNSENSVREFEFNGKKYTRKIEIYNYKEV